MHFKYIIIGLILIFITKSHSKATEANIFYEDEDSSNPNEDDYYDDEEDIVTTTISTENNVTTIRSPKALNSSISAVVTTTPTIPSTTVIPTKQFSDILEIPKSIPKCPAGCDCKNDFKFVNCSNRNLAKVPNDIPEGVLILDLSYNSIKELDDGDLKGIPHNINELIFSGNHIKRISKKVFLEFKNLTNVALNDNHLVEIHPDTFINANKLKVLNLSNNTIITPINGPILNINSLKKLYLTNCSIMEIYDETFSQLYGLETLSLENNNFNQKINTKAFEPLKELTQLKLPDLDEDTIRALCEILQSIDVVNFENFDISCFELSSGQNFAESILTTMNPIDVNITGNGKTGQATKSREAKPVISAALGTTIQPNSGSSLTSTFTNNDSSRLNESFSHMEESYISNKVDEDNDDSDKTYQVAISTQAINHILIAIIIVAIVGLLIGVICRKDYCGVKTKLCRTRRPPPTDQVRPAEEIPLNKVV